MWSRVTIIWHCGHGLTENWKSAAVTVCTNRYEMAPTCSSGSAFHHLGRLNSMALECLKSWNRDWRFHWPDLVSKAQPTQQQQTSEPFAKTKFQLIFSNCKLISIPEHILRPLDQWNLQRPKMRKYWFVFQARTSHGPGLPRLELYKGTSYA